MAQILSHDQFAHIGKYVTYEEVMEKHVNVADAIHLISQINIAGVLKMIATINACCVRPLASQESVRKLNKLLVPLLFDSGIQENLWKSDFGKEKNVVVFHRHQQLLMLKLALLACPDNRGKDWGEDTLHLFGEACLMVNDIAGSREEITSDAHRLEMASNLLPIVELPADDELAGLVGRSLELWLNIPSRSDMLLEKDYVPFGERFLTQYNITLEHFIQGLFIAGAQCEAFDPSKPDPVTSLIINSTTHLDQTRFPKGVYEIVMKIVSCEISVLRDMMVTETVHSLRHDFSLLRRFPFIEVQENIYLCYDRNFLRRYFTDGIYWLIHRLLIPKEQEAFQGFFGKIFAAYVEQVLGHFHLSKLSVPSHSLDIKPRFAKNQGEVCDALIYGDKSCVLMETKGSLLTTRAKYSTDPNLLEQDVHEKFVRSKGGKIKGVSQLANSINKLISGLDTTNEKFKFEGIEIIYPVIVVYDATLTTLWISDYLQSELNRVLEVGNDHPLIRPLTVISVADLELLTALKGGSNLNQIIASYHHKKYIAESFGVFLSRHYKGQIDARKSSFAKNFDDICRDIMRALQE